jgi:hypothetical protein
LNQYTDEDYIESFRMNKSSFEILYSKLVPALKSHPTPVRELISVEKKIAVSLYGCPRTRASNLECVFLNGNEGKKRLEKYAGCNSFLAMN